MKLSAPTLAALLLVANSASADETRRLGGKGGKKLGKKDSSYEQVGKKDGKKYTVTTPATPETPDTSDTVSATCNADGTSVFPSYGEENSQRLLLREGIIGSIPEKMCGIEGGKNVILVVGDGMGWEMVRAGAVAKKVIDELESLGCDTKVGCPGDEGAIAAFASRTLSDYYTEGKGDGLSFQELSGFNLVTTGATVIQGPNAGNDYAPSNSMLEGDTSDHDNEMAPLAMNECGFPLEFNPLDFEADGGNMVLWDNVKGGEYPWDENYYTSTPDLSSGFDPEYIIQHATDSANTAGTLATGTKGAVGMLSQTLYEEKVSTLVEDAVMCGKGGGVYSTVPMFHATPAAFVIHSNNRSDRDKLRKSFLEGNPTMISGVCAGRYYPAETTLESMTNGALSGEWTFLSQSTDVLAEDFYNPLTDLDPDNGDKVIICLGGDFTASGEYNLPYRGVDSTYTSRHCSSGSVVLDPDTNMPIGVEATTSAELCDHYSPEEVANIPSATENVMATLEFLAKDDDGFFMMYEQGDIDWAAHSNHMDDMLGAMLDIDESVGAIMDWIDNNGGYDANALYVTADHDHYLTLSDHFPAALAKFIIDGNSHLITPLNNSNKNPWSEAIKAGRADDDTKTQTEHLADFTTWTPEDIEAVAHYWGPTAAGGNGWGSHSTRPVALFHEGDGGCLDAFEGKGYQVLDKRVVGAEGKIDQVHLHACMMKNLFNL